MRYKTLGLVGLMLVVLDTCIFGQSLKSRDDEVLALLASETKKASENMATETDSGYDALLSTMIYVGEGAALPEENIRGLRKLADSDSNGFKELYATEILLEAGCAISARALDRAEGFVTGRIRAMVANNDKRLLALKVLQTYRDKIIKKKKAQ